MIIKKTPKLKQIDLTLISPININIKKFPLSSTSNSNKNNNLNHASSLPIISNTPHITNTKGQSQLQMQRQRQRQKQGRGLEIDTSSLLFKQTTLPKVKSNSLPHQHQRQSQHQSIVNSSSNREMNPIVKRKRKKYSERYQLLLNNLYHYNPIQEKLLNRLRRDNSIVLSQDYSLDKYHDQLVNALTPSTGTEALMKLRDNLQDLSERFSDEKMIKKKNKWFALAKQLKNSIPKHLSEKFISMGINRFNTNCNSNNRNSKSNINRNSNCDNSDCM